MQNLNTLSSNPNPNNVIKLICSIMAADLKNQIPLDIVNRAYKFISLIYKKLDTEIFAGITFTSLMREGVPRSLDTSLKELEGKVLEDFSTAQTGESKRTDD
ncbi:MAG: hypothetical protein MRK02_10130 [Candidatus Scalindua sp.]|nr:hypothetical protein [Candidatus Scalindua sp.]